MDAASATTAPSFSALILSIASQAAEALGLDSQGKTHSHQNLGTAKLHIDLLLVLQEKTKGNLSTDEDKLIRQITTDLQLRYVQSSGRTP